MICLFCRLTVYCIEVGPPCLLTYRAMSAHRTQQILLNFNSNSWLHLWYAATFQALFSMFLALMLNLYQLLSWWVTLTMHFNWDAAELHEQCGLFLSHLVTWQQKLSVLIPIPDSAKCGQSASVFNLSLQETWLLHLRREIRGNVPRPGSSGLRVLTTFSMWRQEDLPQQNHTHNSKPRYLSRKEEQKVP